MFQGLLTMEKSATLIIYWDGKSKLGDYSTPVILEYKYDGIGSVNGRSIDGEFTINEVLEIANIVKSYDEHMSTDKFVMCQVLKDMINLSPTDRIGIVAGSHASSWLAASRLSRAFGEENGVNIDIVDMADAISSTGKSFDFILFDACYMGSIEVCYDFKEVSSYTIASVMEIPAYGFPYNLMLKYLYEGCEDGYKKACQTYLTYYKERVDKNISNSWGTITLIDNQEIDNLTVAIREEILKHKNILKSFDVKSSSLQEYGKLKSPIDYRYVSVDLAQLIKTLNNGVMPELFSNSLQATVVFTGCLTNTSYEEYNVDEENYCGLGIYVPMQGKISWNTYFKTINWYKDSGWNEVSFDWYF